MSTPNHPTLPRGFMDFCLRHPALAGLPDTLATGVPEVSVRVNPAKGARVPQGAAAVPWCPGGFYLDCRPTFTFDPALHQGLYYVQDASSMAISHVIKQVTNPGEPVLYLDACAAPGGKTTAAMAALPPGSAVLANEYDPRRAAALVENLERWGHPAAMVRRGDTAQLAAAGGVFHVIAADVPCSGEGMMRKEPAAIAQWSEALTRSCATLQQSIVNDLWGALRPGGVLIYSTCTFNTLENEDNLRYMVEELGAQPLALGLDAFQGVGRELCGPYPAYRFTPGAVRGEGLFMCAVRKPASEHAHVPLPKPKKPKGKAPQLPPQHRATLQSWLTSPHTFTLDDQGEVYALPQPWARALGHLAQSLGGVIMPGVHMATLKNNTLVPAHPLALYQDLATQAFTNVEVDAAQALQYLCRQAPELPPGTPRGIVLLTHLGTPLGFAKNLGTRANNLLPGSRRILAPNPTPVKIL